MKLHIWIYLGERKCHAQFLSYSPLSIFWESLGRWHVFRGTPKSSLFWCFRRTTTTYFWRNVVKLILSLKMKLTRSFCNHIANLRITDYVTARRLYDFVYTCRSSTLSLGLNANMDGRWDILNGLAVKKDHSRRTPTIIVHTCRPQYVASTSTQFSHRFRRPGTF